jgi:hypothetical protein
MLFVSYLKVRHAMTNSDLIAAYEDSSAQRWMQSRMLEIRSHPCDPDISRVGRVCFLSFCTRESPDMRFTMYFFTLSSRSGLEAKATGFERRMGKHSKARVQAGRGHERRYRCTMLCRVGYIAIVRKVSQDRGSVRSTRWKDGDLKVQPT